MGERCAAAPIVTILWIWCFRVVALVDSLGTDIDNLDTRENTASVKVKMRLHLATIIPANNSRLFSMDHVQTSMEYAIDRVYSPLELLPREIKLVLNYSDSRCSPGAAPVAAFNFYMQKTVDVFIGPVCDYSLEDVARYSRIWNLPVISPGGFAHDFGLNKTEKHSEFSTLTRAGATFNSLAAAVIQAIGHYNWTRTKVIYEIEGRAEITPKFCFLAVSAIVYYMKQQNVQASSGNDFHPFTPGVDNIEAMLRTEVGNEYSSK